jgi:hypothetical protein
MTSMYNPAHPGLVLRDYLGELSITTVAERLGVTRAALSRILNGWLYCLVPRSERRPKCGPSCRLATICFRHNGNHTERLSHSPNWHEQPDAQSSHPHRPRGGFFIPGGCLMFPGAAAKHRSFMWFQYFPFCLTSCG